MAIIEIMQSVSNDPSVIFHSFIIVQQIFQCMGDDCWCIGEEIPRFLTVLMINTLQLHMAGVIECIQILTYALC